MSKLVIRKAWKDLMIPAILIFVGFNFLFGEELLSGIPMCTDVRTVIPDEDWRYIVNRYSVVFTLFSPARNISEENKRVKWIKSLNPNVKILVYGSAINTANFPLSSREHYKSGGVYQRDFKYGKVIVNRTGQKVEINLQVKWKTDKGKIAQSQIQISPYTGMILRCQ